MIDPDRNAASSAKAAGACPICGKPTVQSFRPFCSRHCADVDLHRWFSGQYAIPVQQDEDEDGALPESEAPALNGGSDPR